MKVLLTLSSYLLQSRFEKIFSGFEGVEYTFRTLNENNINRMLKIEEPQIVIADFCTNKEGCINKIKKIKSINPKIKVIIITPTSDDELIKRLGDNGVDYCFEISDMIEILYTLVNELLLVDNQSKGMSGYFTNYFSKHIVSLQ